LNIPEILTFTLFCKKVAKFIPIKSDMTKKYQVASIPNLLISLLRESEYFLYISGRGIKSLV
jgi:hypothetical protein